MTYQFEPDEEQSFGEQALDFGKGAIRQGARTTTNLATLGIGLPGDIFSMINEYIANPTSEAFGGKKVPYEQTLLGKAIPTTETHRKNIQSVTGDYLKPQNELEKFYDETMDLTATLLNPSRLVSKAPQAVKKGEQIGRAFVKSLGINMAGDAVKEATGSDTAGAATKIGGIVLTSLIDKKKAAQFAGELFQDAHNLLIHNPSFYAMPLDVRMNGLAQQITKGRPIQNLSSGEKFVIDQIEDVKRLIQNGQIPIEQAWAQKQTIGKNLNKLWDITKDYDATKAAKRQAMQVYGALDDTIKQYGKVRNKPFLDKYQNANEAFSAIVDSEWIKKAGQFMANYLPASKGLSTLLGIGLEIGSGATLAYPAIKVMQRITQSPTLRKLYLANTKAAAKENSIAFNRTLRALDEKLQEEEAKDQFEFVED